MCVCVPACARVQAWYVFFKRPAGVPVGKKLVDPHTHTRNPDVCLITVIKRQSFVFRLQVLPQMFRHCFALTELLMGAVR